MFPNGNVGLENSKFYEDVPARGHLIGRAATGSCPKSTFAASPDDRTEKTIPEGQDPPGADEDDSTFSRASGRAQAPSGLGMRMF